MQTHEEIEKIPERTARRNNARNLFRFPVDLVASTRNFRQELHNYREDNAMVGRRDGIKVSLSLSSARESSSLEKGTFA